MASSAPAQSTPYPSADLRNLYEDLLGKINSIPIYDNHSHPGFPDDSDVDAAWATYVQQQGVPVVGADLKLPVASNLVFVVRQVEVTLHNRKKYKATVVGTDPPHDLAVIQIKAPELVPAILGDSQNLPRF